MILFELSADGMHVVHLWKITDLFIHVTLKLKWFASAYIISWLKKWCLLLDSPLGYTHLHSQLQTATSKEWRWITPSFPNIQTKLDLLQIWLIKEVYQNVKPSLPFPSCLLITLPSSPICPNVLCCLCPNVSYSEVTAPLKEHIIIKVLNQKEGR